MKKISNKCLDLVKEFEGCRLTAYRDEVGVWTIGYGITNSDFKITKKIIRKGMKISKATAEKWLEESLNKKYFFLLVLEYDKQYNWDSERIRWRLSAFATTSAALSSLLQTAHAQKL